MVFESSPSHPISIPHILDSPIVSSRRTFHYVRHRFDFYLLFLLDPLVSFFAFFPLFSFYSTIHHLNIEVETGIEPIFFDLQSNTSPFCHPTFFFPIQTLPSSINPFSSLLLSLSSLLIASFHTLNVRTIAFLLLLNPMLLVPLYIEHLANLVLVLLESIPLNVHAIHVLLLQEYRLSLFSQSLFALMSPIVVQNLAFSEPFDKLFYIHRVFEVNLSMRFFVFFDVVTLVHFVLFVVLLTFLFLLSSLSLSTFHSHHCLIGIS